MTKQEILDAIEEYITGNGLQEITGPIMNAILTAMAKIIPDDTMLTSAFGGAIDPSSNIIVVPGKSKWFFASEGTYNSAGGIVIGTKKLAILSYDGSGWKKLEIDLPIDAPKVVIQKAINEVIGSNQTEIIAYGKGTSFNNPTTGTAWVGNRLIHKAGTLKSITFNALKTEEYKFVVATIVPETNKLTFGATYFTFTPPQAGMITFNVPAGITLETNQTVMLSVNTTGKIGYTVDSAITDCEYCETVGGANVAYTPHAGFVALVMNIEVQKGRTPFSTDEMMLFVYNGINGIGDENKDFTTTVNTKKNSTIKYTKLSPTSTAAFQKGELVFGNVTVYKLTGGSISFTSDFLATHNSETYKPAMTNIISFWKEYDKVRYSIENQPLEPIV